MNNLSMPPAHLRDTLSRLAYFRGWDAGVVGRLAAGASQHAVAKDMPVLTRGALPEQLYILVSGQVRLYLPLSNGMERIVSLVMPGEGFGEAAIMLNKPLPYGAAACRDSHIIAIGARAYQAELGTSPALLEHTLRLVAGQYQATLRDMEICAQPSSLQRVVRFLMNQETGSMLEGGYEFTLPGRKRDIAAKLGLTQETFSRMLSFLGQQGVIAMRGAAIRVGDGARLRQMDAAICAKVAQQA
ncbi:MAG: Crp/Fnr family transcriptional regulator [Thiobacillus sp.]|nr:Crp/Fnr family transcriptional regulator [Thiobacillus sp.]